MKTKQLAASFWLIVSLFPAQALANGLSQVQNQPPRGAQYLNQNPQPQRNFPLSLANASSTNGLSKLLKELTDPDPDIRLKAAQELGQLRDIRALKGLFGAKTDRHKAVRQAADEALERLITKASLPTVLKQLESADISERCAAIWALGQIGEPTSSPAVQKSLKDLDPVVRRAAAEALGQIGEITAGPALRVALQDSDKQVRRAAAKSLGYLKDSSALPALLQALQDPEPTVRSDVANILGDLGEQAAVPALIQSLKDPHEWVRVYAAGALSQLQAQEAVPALLKALQDPDKWVRVCAADALARLGNSSAVQALLPLLKDQDEDVRDYVAEALGQFGDRSALPPLLQALHDASPRVRTSAAGALGQLKDTAAVQALQLALQDPEAWVRLYAARSLGKLERSDLAVPALLKALKQDIAVRKYVLQELGKQASYAVLPDLLPTLKDPETVVRLTAAEALGAIGQRSFAGERGAQALKALKPNPTNNAQVLSALIQALADSEASVREAVFAALLHWQIQPLQPELLQQQAQVALPIQLEVKLFRAKLLHGQQDTAHAFALVQELLQAVEPSQHTLLQVQAHWLNGQLLLQQNQPAQAQQTLEQALALIGETFVRKDFRKLPNAFANTRYHLGQTLLAGKQFARAEQVFEQALADLEDETRLYYQGNDALEALIRFALANAMELKANGLRIQTLDFVAQKGLEQNAQVLKESQLALEKVIQAEIEGGNSEEAFRLLDKYKLGLLKQSFDHLALRFENPLKQQSLGKIQWLQDSENAKEQEKQKLEAELKNSGSSPQGNSVFEELKSDIKAIQQQKKQLLKELQQHNPILANLWTVNPLSMKEVQRQLPADTALLQTMVTENTLYLFFLTSDDITLETQAITQAQLAEKVQSFVAQLRDRRQDPTALAKELYQLLLSPFSSELKAYPRLGILPSKELNRIPIGALMEPAGDYLIQNKQVFSLPNASLLQTLTQQTQPISQVLALGNADGSLYHSQQEVNNIAALLPGSKAYVTEQATEALVKAAPQNPEFKDLNVLHLATHGIVDMADANASYLVLSKDAQQDGQLSLREIYDLDWPYQLVFLSACETGVGKSMGQEVDSLGNAFMAGGARTLIASLWPVDDAATGHLSKAFYTALKAGESRAEALQLAQQQTLKKYSHPYYWAPFVLSGDWK